MAIDVIGVMLDKSAESPTEIEGYHVNSTSDIAEWLEFKVYPETPARLWLGSDVVHCYKFESKAQYESLKLEDE